MTQDDKENNVYDTYAIRSIYSETVAMLSKIQKYKNEADGIKTGFCDIDNFLHGFHNGELTTLSSASLSAQMELTASIIYNIAVKNNTATGIISLGSSTDYLIKLILAICANISHLKLYGDFISEKEIEASIKIVETELASCPIVMATSPVIDASKLEKTVADMKEKHGVKIIFIVAADYVLPADVLFFKDNDYVITDSERTIKELSSETKKEYKANFIKCLATRFDIPIVSSEEEKSIWLEYFSDSILQIEDVDETDKMNITIKRKGCLWNKVTLKRSASHHGKFECYDTR